MKQFWKVLAALALALVPGPAMNGQVTQMQNDLVVVSVDRVEIADVRSDRIKFVAIARVTASRKLKIKRIRFEQVRIDGLPVYLGPLEENLELEKGVARSLPPIPLMIYIRDLRSLDPLQKAVREGKAEVQGLARIDLDTNLLERALVGQWDVHADMPIDMTTAIDAPGGQAGRTAALATLRAAQLALELGDSALGILNLPGSKSDDDLRSKYTPSLVVAESHYSLELQGKQRVNVVIRGLGVRVSADRFVVPGEMLEPWNYDVDASTALQTGTASLIEGSTDLLVWPAGKPLDLAAARSLNKGLIEVVRKPGGSERTRVPAGERGAEIRIARRDSGENLAVLRFTRTEDNGAQVQLAPEEGQSNTNWDRLTLFRVDSKGGLEALSTPATSKDNRILIEDPVDDSGFGSLLAGPDGVVGMLQDERSGIVLRGPW